MGKRKNELRADLKRVLANLDPRWIHAASREVCTHLSGLLDRLDSPRIEHVLAWVSFFPGEVDLSHFIDEQLSKRAVYLPRVAEDATMKFVSIDQQWSENVAAGMFGIPEPRESGVEPYNPLWAKSTAVIVPGIAFDESGRRLGRGKGHYDRFLNGSQMMTAAKIGVGWTLQVIQEVPTEAHDTELDWICHERGVIQSGPRFDEEAPF